MSTITDLADQAVKALICDVALNVVDAEAVAAAPWLGLPVIHPVFRFCLGRFANKIFVVLSRSIDFKIIEVQVQGEKSEYQEALANYKQANQSGDKDAFDKAEADLKRKLADLIRVRK